MTFTPVDRLPDRGPNKPQKKNTDHLTEFLKMNVKYARMDYGPLEYASLHSAKGANDKTIKHYGLPIRTQIINSELYLINLELEGPK